MNNIIEVDQENRFSVPEVSNDNGRRRALKHVLNFTGKFALSGVPIALAGIWNKSFSQVDTEIPAGTRINHLLLIEYLLAEFFETAASKGLPLLERMSIVDAFKIITKHDRQHIEILKGRLIPFKTMPIPKPVFDFTGGGGSGNGPFKDVFTNPAVLGAVARALKDLSVRAYIAQAGPFLLGDTNIHPVESRHAARLRTLAFSNGLESEQAWITRNQTAAPYEELRRIYFGEENTVQQGIQIVNINGKGITVDYATEAFDEPLSMEVVNSIIAPFIAST